MECLLEQLLLLNIINPHAIQPGIFWYIGMAFQFYIWYIWFRKLSGNQLALIALCTTLTIALLPSAYVSYIRHNSIGWMPEFVFGILLARSEQESIVFHGRALSAGIALLGIVPFALSQYTFMLSGVCFVYLLLIYKTQFAKMKILLYLRKISASFICCAYSCQADYACRDYTGRVELACCHSIGYCINDCYYVRNSIPQNVHPN